jgi:hypothetical protein
MQKSTASFSIKRIGVSLVTKCFARRDEERRKRALLNLDWVVEMLRHVHEDTPEATARWWDGLKETVTDAWLKEESNEMDRSKTS